MLIIETGEEWLKVNASRNISQIYVHRIWVIYTSS